MAIVVPATPAAAANSVDCNLPAIIDEYARVSTNVGPPYCVATAGSMDVDIAHAHDFHSDDNKITFFYTVENGYQNALILEKWQDHARGFGLSAHVTSVVIW